MRSSLSTQLTQWSAMTLGSTGSARVFTNTVSFVGSLRRVRSTGVSVAKVIGITRLGHLAGQPGSGTRHYLFAVIAEFVCTAKLIQNNFLFLLDNSVTLVMRLKHIFFLKKKTPWTWNLIMCLQCLMHYCIALLIIWEGRVAFLVYTTPLSNVLKIVSFTVKFLKVLWDETKVLNLIQI